MNLVKGNLLRIKQDKTGTVVYIPLLPEAQAILDKYNWELPVLANQNANENIKKLFKAFGSNLMIHDVRQVGKGDKLFNLTLHEVINF
jgi:hypothetical protein